MAFIAAYSVPSQAQHYLGVATGNWSGMSSMYLNPANIADNRDGLVIDVFNMNVGVDNSLGKLNLNPGLKRFIDGGENDINEVFNFTGKKTFSLTAPYGEFRGPAVMFSFKHKHSLAVSTRVRGFNQLANFDQSLYRSITDSNYSRNGDLDLTAKNFNWTAQMWAELAVTYGGVIYEKNNNEIKVGATLRYLGGIGYLGLKGSNLDVHYANGSDSFYAHNMDLEYASNLFSASSALNTGVNASNIFDHIFKGKGGNGIGGDIGIVYDRLEDGVTEKYDMDGKTGLSDYSRNRYKFRVSASVVDLGYIVYPSKNNFGINVSGDGYIKGADFTKNVKDYTDFQNYIHSKGFNADTNRNENKVYMPAKIVVGVDYHIKKNFYVNATYFANVNTGNFFGNTYYNQISVTPRYDTKKYSVALPITYSGLTNQMKLGLGLRYTGFFIGSDDMLTLVSQHQYGVNFYVGGFVPFGNKRPRDRDGDHVSDRRDRCPDEYGEWSNHGCPVDEKKNGKEAVDTTDNCPDATGLFVQTNKDSDKDGIPDEEDACPNEPGVASNHGCPEKNPFRKQADNAVKSVIAWKNTKTPLSKSDLATIDRFAKLGKEYPQVKIVLECYSDDRDHSRAKNIAACKKVCDIAAKELKSKGIDKSRIKYNILGAHNPIASNDTEEGRAQNRRLVIYIENNK